MLTWDDISTHKLYVVLLEVSVLGPISPNITRLCHILTLRQISEALTCRIVQIVQIVRGEYSGDYFVEIPSLPDFRKHPILRSSFYLVKVDLRLWVYAWGSIVVSDGQVLMLLLRFFVILKDAQKQLAIQVSAHIIPI